jgi:hypothetical protein
LGSGNRIHAINKYIKLQKELIKNAPELNIEFLAPGAFWT